MNIKEVLREKVSQAQIGKIRRAFDIIGSIAVVDIPRDIKGRKTEQEIGKAIMKVHGNVKAVYRKMSGMQGLYRVRKLKHIAGEKISETIYKESGVRMLLDVTKVYFSPRLATERARIASLVKKGEKVLVLFAGVGPFALVIAKKKPQSRIVAVELNHNAVEYMKRNVSMNKMDNISVVEGDVKKIVPRRYSRFADRIVMPLPKDGGHFLGAALTGAKRGAVVHFYSFSDTKEPFAKVEAKIERIARQHKRKISFLERRVVRPYSPKIVQVVIDFKLKN